MYGELQKDYEVLRTLYLNSEFIYSWHEELNYTIREDETNILVFEDRMCDASDSNQLTRLFSRGSHNRNFTEIYQVH